ncbi:unnamed protein product [Trichobilharzia szidati]|nr:unnamed protein product [Trichobilharzia szidati]
MEDVMKGKEMETCGLRRQVQSFSSGGAMCTVCSRTANVTADLSGAERCKTKSILNHKRPHLNTSASNGASVSTSSSSIKQPIKKRPCVQDTVTESILDNHVNTTPTAINGKSVNYSPQNTSTSLSSTNGTLNKAQSKDSITAHSNCLPMSNSDQNDDQFLYNQIQDDILIKILNTIQQLTAKLDADANPPEVIQNCRAIQACLDTINAIKRVKSNRSDDECSRSEVSLASYNSHFTHHLNSLSTNYSIQQHNGFSSSSSLSPPPPQQQQPSVIQPL